MGQHPPAGSQVRPAFPRSAELLPAVRRTDRHRQAESWLAAQPARWLAASALLTGVGATALALVILAWVLLAVVVSGRARRGTDQATTVDLLKTHRFVKQYEDKALPISETSAGESAPSRSRIAR